MDAELAAAARGRRRRRPLLLHAAGPPVLSLQSPSERRRRQGEPHGETRISFSDTDCVFPSHTVKETQDGGGSSLA